MNAPPSPGTVAFLKWLHDRDEPWNTRVWAVARLVPSGAVTTYGDIGSILGSPRFARQVGWALAALTAKEADIPWHRVINAKGMISHRGDVERALEQGDRLVAEGVHFSEKGRCDLADLRWDYPRIDRSI